MYIAIIRSKINDYVSEPVLLSDKRSGIDYASRHLFHIAEGVLKQEYEDGTVVMTGYSTNPLMVVAEITIKPAAFEEVYTY